MRAETLHQVTTFLVETPHVFGTIAFFLAGIYILFIAGKLMRSEK